MAIDELRMCYGDATRAHVVLGCPERLDSTNKPCVGDPCKFCAKVSWAVISTSSADKLSVFLSGLAVAVFVMKAFSVLKGKC